MLTLVYTNLIKLAQIVTLFIGFSKKLVCVIRPIKPIVLFRGYGSLFQALHIDQLEGFPVL